MTRILVVEDEESFSDALGYMLRREGFEVSMASTGPGGLEEFDRSRRRHGDLESLTAQQGTQWVGKRLLDLDDQNSCHGVRAS